MKVFILILFLFFCCDSQKTFEAEYDDTPHNIYWPDVHLPANLTSSEAKAILYQVALLHRGICMLDKGCNKPYSEVVKDIIHDVSTFHKIKVQTAFEKPQTKPRKETLSLSIFVPNLMKNRIRKKERFQPAYINRVNTIHQFPRDEKEDFTLMIEIDLPEPGSKK